MTTAISDLKIPRGVNSELWRGGMSEAEIMLLEEVPADTNMQDAICLTLRGEGNQNQVGGSGGNDQLKNKCAFVSKSKIPGVDIDYQLVQVLPGTGKVDRGASCGNILVAVACVAIENGLIGKEKIGDEKTTVRINHNGTIYSVTVPTPGREVTYDGDEVIDGVIGSGARIEVMFDVASREVVLPFGPRIDILGKPAIIANVGQWVVGFRGEDFGLNGTETVEWLNANMCGEVGRHREAAAEFLQSAGLQKYKDIKQSGVPKTLLYFPPNKPGDVVDTKCLISPTKFHDSLGANVATTAMVQLDVEGSPVRDLARNFPAAANKFARLGTPIGSFGAYLNTDGASENPQYVTAGYTRTARAVILYCHRPLDQNLMRHHLANMPRAQK